MQLLRSLVYALIFYSGTALFVFAGLAASLFGSSATRALVKVWAWFGFHLADIVLGVRSHVKGEVPRGAVLIAVKHQSMYETLEMVRIAETPVIVI